MIDAETRARIAHHEAGHACVAIALGVAVGEIIVHETGGDCRLCGDPDVRTAALIFLAGSIAERRWDPALPLDRMLCARYDEDVAWTLLDGSARVIRVHRALAARLVDQHWAAIRLIARTLSRDRILSGDAVLALMERAA